MKNIVMGLVVATALGLSSTSMASLLYNEKVTCYTFKKGANKPNGTGACEVFYSRGAGGSVEVIEYKGRTYTYEDSDILDENGDWIPQDNSYMRDHKTYRKIPEMDDYSNIQPYMTCRPGKKVDICYYHEEWFED